MPYLFVNQDWGYWRSAPPRSPASQLGLPVNFIICNDYSLQEVQLLNSLHQTEKTDYLNAFCDLGYPEYLKFKVFI